MQEVTSSSLVSPRSELSLRMRTSDIEGMIPQGVGLLFFALLLKQACNGHRCCWSCRWQKYGPKQCKHALRRVHPLPNDYDHTKVEMPAEHCLCPKMFAACNKRHICETNGKLHLQSIQIKNVLAVALYHTPKKVQSAFTKTECGNFELNQTKEATKIRDSFQLHRKLFFDDYYLLDTSATHTLWINTS